MLCIYPYTLLEVLSINIPKILFVIDRELLEKLRDYRFENRINSMSEAIRQLLEIGLAAAGKKGARKPPERDRDRS